MRALGRQIWENGVRKLCIDLHKLQKHSEKSLLKLNSRTT